MLNHHLVNSVFNRGTIMEKYIIASSLLWPAV